MHTPKRVVMSRRSIIKGSLVLGGGLLGGQLVGCATPPAPTSNPAQPRVVPDASTGTTGSRKVLLAYFSRAGENYFYGDRKNLDVGNTEVVANLIASATEVDVYRIEPIEPYPFDYEATVERNQQEQESDARPPITGALPNVGSYDTVLLGSPIWNVRPPMIMRTFLDAMDFSGKAIHPFVTYAVSGIGATMADYTRACPGASIGDGLAVRGEEAAGAQTAVREWLQRNGILTLQ